MKPLNADTQGCNPISSNCVIWQGPDLDCIGLCKGDTISNVIAKLAEELCSVLEDLNMDSYDIACLNDGGCDPKSFQALIQVIVDKICALEGIHKTEAGSASGAIAGSTENTAKSNNVITPILSGDNVPDAVLPLPEVYQYKNAQGDTVETAQLVDMAVASANKIQGIVGQMDTINSTLTYYNNRLDTLEVFAATPPESNLPYLSPTSIAPPTPLLQLDVFTALLEEEFGLLRSATGTDANIYDAITLQQAGLNQRPQLTNHNVNYDSLSDWKPTVTNLADVISNILLVQTDIYSAVLSMQEILYSDVCNDLQITMVGTLTNPTLLTIFFSGTVPAGYTEQVGLITITDAANNELTIAMPITGVLNDPAGYGISLATTPINGASDLMLSLPILFKDDFSDSECGKVLTDAVLASGVCPTVTITPDITTIGYAFTYLGDAASISVVLYAEDGITILQTDTTIVTGPLAISNSFTGLLASSQYKVRVEITADGALDATLCPFSGVITLANACVPPSGLLGTLIQ